ncbi:MAG TPA: FAD-dependent tricarballylate dehydrogenase TcuA [Kofleriaceae bacterium]|nr:FAD-dependent tricarballylate dehydrogenase TcuA [Kofleriaceae bacterium]
MTTACDVVVVGAGNAALVAAVRAAELGARVLVLEAAPEEHHGGNSRHAGANFRIPFEHVDELAPLELDLTPAVRATLAASPYPRQRLLGELVRASRERADPRLLRLLVDSTLAACGWLRSHGLAWVPGIKGRPVERLDDWQLNPMFSVCGKGPALVAGLRDAAARRGVAVRHSARARGLVRSPDGAICGLRVDGVDRTIEIEAPRVILACGGFEANPEMRARYLGPALETVKLRGTRYNRGDGLAMALAAGAQLAGHGAHICPIDERSPEFSTIEIGEDSRRCRYGLGILVNRAARRFLDEAADQPWATYASVGHEVQRQDGRVAYEISDAKTAGVPFEQELYATTPPIEAATIAELAARLGISGRALEAEIARFNAAVRADVAFQPDRLDGRSTRGATPEKSNWALAIDTPPYRAYPICAGLTFTYAGVAIDPACRVLGAAGAPIAGLFAAGQMAGGFFVDRYLGATGLARGVVTGMTAAEAATAT